MNGVTHLLVGPAEHGVVRYGGAVHAALADHGHHLVSVPGVDDPGRLAAELTGELVHLQFTDRLFGSSASAAARTVADLVTALRQRGIGVTATLHDLPQTSDGTGLAARIDCYRTVLAVLDAVVVSSYHEVALVSDHLGAHAVTMIPLVVEVHDDVEPSTNTARPTVGVLGFLYPGKGHVETVRAMDHLDASVGFVALGAPSPGHADLVDELQAVAQTSGRSVEVTGFLDDDELHRRMAQVTVPVAHHRHMSASASVNTWRSRRRAPLVPRTRYTEEIARRSPGTVVPYAEDDVAAAITRALADPGSTWIADGVPVHPTPAEVADAHRSFFAEVLR